jgi:hypothetical protein
MKNLALEVFEPRQVGDVGVMQDAGCRDYDVRDIAGAIAGLELPTTVLKITTDDLFSESDLLVDAVFLSDGFEIGLDFGTRRKPMAPIGVGFERIAVQM